MLIQARQADILVDENSKDVSSHHGLYLSMIQYLIILIQAQRADILVDENSKNVSKSHRGDILIRFY